MNTIHSEILPDQTDREQLLGAVASKTEAPIIPAVELPVASELSTASPHYPDLSKYARGDHTDGYM